MSATTVQKRPASARLTGENVTVVVLLALVLIGAAAGIYRLVVGLGPTTNLSDAIPWGIWIGFDFALIAFSGAAFTMAGLVYVFGQEQFRPAMRPAVLFGLVGYIAVLVLLLLDLGRWDRFWSFFINWNGHSPLFEISWCIVLYSIILAVEFSPQLFERVNKEGPVRLVYRIGVALAIIGVTLSSLHQSTLGTLYLNMPHRLQALWYSPLLPLFFFISSIMAGLAVTMIIYPLACRIRGKQADVKIPQGLAAIAAWVMLVYTLLKLGDILVAGELPALFAFDRTSLLMWIELGLGAIVPMILFFIPSLRAQRLWQTVGALLILFGVLMNRFNATLFAQINRPGASYSPHVLEWLSTLGVLAAVALAWYLGVKYLTVLDSEADAKYH
ncbi:MAG: NrfD/PsrC family molybdoenzyme membrane anchor subunit [Chloroflexota bacterium]|nr:NrfD/PsrC family molybdoenzyme membrane anchor subunit [Chloroflexota bacterium]